MVAELFNGVLSGTSIIPAGSHAVAFTLLCGVSGTAIIPVQVNGEGRLITTSGA